MLMQTNAMAENLVGSPPATATSGTLRATISLGQRSFRGYFYLLRDGSIDSSTSGAADWLGLAGLRGKHDTYKAKPPPEELSEFVDSIAGCLDTPATEDHGSLISLLEKPPVVREIVPFTTNALNAFRLHPGPFPAKFKHLVQMPPPKTSKVSNEALKSSRNGNLPSNYNESSYFVAQPPAPSAADESARIAFDFGTAVSSQDSDFMSPGGGAYDDDVDFQMPQEKKRKRSEKKRRAK